MADIEAASVWNVLNETVGSQMVNVTTEEFDMQTLEVLAKDGGKVAVVLTFAMMVAYLIGNVLHRYRISFLPESLATVMVGAIVGLVLPTGNSSISKWTLERITIQEESVINEMVLSLILLPIIIYEAGWSMRHKDFVSQFPYILLFAIFGTLISMAIVGGLILATADLHGISNPRVAFAYAALISAVDPVATLATYAHLNVDPLLNTIVFGESVINDAVAIVLFKTLNDVPSQVFDSMTGVELTGRLTFGVLQLLTCSLGLGIALGCIYCLILRFSQLGQSTSASTIFIFFTAFFTYNFAEAVCGQSGIIAVLFCALLMGGFATPHLSTEGAMMTSFLLKQMSSIADMFVFLFVGIAVVYIEPNGLIFGLWVTLFCLAGRLIGTVPLGLLTNCIKNAAMKHRPSEKRHLLSWRHILMMWHAGLRGGIALVLTLELGDWVDEIDGKGTKECLRNATLVIICGFLLFFGGTTQYLLAKLGIPMGGVGKMEHHKGDMREYQNKILSWVKPILVGRPNHDNSNAVIANILSDIRALRRGETPTKIASQDTARSAEWTGNAYDMFGTFDPCHADEIALASSMRSSIPEMSESDEEDELDSSEGGIGARD
eukprot:CAMPEP_0203968624 /NCGR_PEP_ID=MMETSP0359-20131031/97042_1 /ASSEMBLY_ACC=CAM_ASM_000338 /TAXON_ID=268821 /ORGANISM="Scrippsiella Hangoei, Strain SHTV-5" /LENGTH=604 /DNA_ID=CAMNT_0050906551 /DNA_START=119 /DNA_END=1933 /DNA_ORIENTATION=-